MYKCTQCGHTQDADGVCQQCGSQTAIVNDSNESDAMPEETVSEESTEETV